MIVKTPGQIRGQIGSELSGKITIQNNTDQAVQLMIKRISTSIGTGQKTWFCAGGECFEPTTERLPISIKLEPGEKLENFNSILKAGITEGFSTVKYQVYDKFNPQIFAEFELNYLIEDNNAEKALFNSNQVIINDVYPNPVSEFATVEYQLLDPESDTKIVVHSLLGSIMSEYKLRDLETNIKIHTESFNPGVYFYTLYIDGDAVMTRKLIVRN